MEIFICRICHKKFKSLLGLSKHSSRFHYIDPKTIYIDYCLNGNTPKCECGCGGDVPFISVGKGFSRFIKTHHNRVPGKNNFHKNPLTHQKAIETQKQNWKEGKYIGWWEKDDEETRSKIEAIKDKLRNDKDRGNKISQSLSGVPKSEKTKENISKTQKERYKKNPLLIENLSKNRIKWLKRKKKKKTKLEEKFETLLGLIPIQNEFQYEFKKKFYDFYIPQKNILIEVDGDFYHCNPSAGYLEPEYEVQKITVKNDKIKTELCEKNNIILLRFWEKDINERPEWVISELKKKIL